MKNLKVRGLITLVILVGVLVGCAAPVVSPEPVATAIPVEETPVNTNTVITVIGGKVTYEDPEIVKILDEKYGITVKVLTNSGLDKFKQNGVIDYSGVEVIMGGSATFADELNAAYPDGLPNSSGEPIRDYKPVTVGQSPLVLHIKTENGDIDAFVNAGIFIKNGASYTVSGESMLKMIDCGNENADWTSIGVDIPGKCRFGFSNPPQSSGGRYTLSYIASCLVNREDPCTSTITVDQLDPVLPVLLNAFEVSGKKSGDNDSVQFYYDWANSSNASERIMFAYESAPISWLNSPNVPSMYKTQAANSIALVYPEFTFMSTQVGIALDGAGKELVNIMTTDPEIIAVLNNRIGFRAGYVGGKAQIPNVLPSISQDQSIFTIIPDPRSDVGGSTGAIVMAICEKSPETPGCKK